MHGIKHLIECKCMLPQMKSKGILHKFVVFSQLDDKDDVIIKFAQCNNCGVIHKIVDLCQSHIMTGKEHMSSILTIEDVKNTLQITSKDLVNVLERAHADLATWEYAKFLIENKKWGSFITLSSEIEDDMKQVKYITVLGDNLFKIETHMREISV